MPMNNEILGSFVVFVGQGLPCKIHPLKDQVFSVAYTPGVVATLISRQGMLSCFSDSFPDPIVESVGADSVSSKCLYDPP